MDRARLLIALVRETTAFRHVLEHADLAAPVEACPGWNLSALSGHLAGVHRMARNAIVEGQMRDDGTPPLLGRSAVVDWYRASADGLLDVLRSTPPGTACPGFGPRPRTVDFWVRRQAHEAAVHRWDAELAAGADPKLDPDLSADGVAEVVAVMLPRQRHLGRIPPLQHAVGLQRKDGPERWVIGGGDQVATVRADATTLLLLLWRRRGLDAADVRGNAGAAAALLSQALTP